MLVVDSHCDVTVGRGVWGDHGSSGEILEQGKRFIYANEA